MDEEAQRAFDAGTAAFWQRAEALEAVLPSHLRPGYLAADYGTVEALRRATDAELGALYMVGPRTIRALRQWLAAHPPRTHPWWLVG